LLTGAILSGTCAAIADPGDAFSEPGLGSASDYVNSSGSAGAYEIRLLGIEVNDGAARMKNGHPVSGVEVISTIPHGAAAAAGLRGRHEGAQVALTIGLLAGAVFFPPAMLGMMALQQSGLGSSHEIIIAVDGQRTRDVADLGDALAKAQAGEIVYLTVVSNGRREQIPVELPVARIPVQAKADR
jgi:S1-C subfamily serine protease